MYTYIKNILDFTIGSFVLILLLPFLCLVSILIVIFDGRPVFFIQNRIGKSNTVFKIIKFRTMKTLKPSEDYKINEEITYLGQFLRNYSIDELPEIINILKGDMSFVGPRPLLENYLEFYNSEQIKRHLVKPGITGLAQINGRNEISWEKKFELDVKYVKEISFYLDCHIFFKTIFKLFSKEGIYDKEKKQMSFFNPKGKNKKNK